MPANTILRLPTRLIILLIAGAVTGLLAVVLFGVIHAITIVPIWDRLGSGIVFCLLTGSSIGWARYYLSHTKHLHNGALFGLLVWSCLLPMTLFGIIARLTGIHNTESSLQVIISSALSFLTCACAGYLITKRWQAGLALGTASLLLAFTQAGPVALMNSKRAWALFFALLFVYVLSGLVLQSVEYMIKRIWPQQTLTETTFSEAAN